MASQDEAALLAKAAKASSEAFLALFEAHREAIFRLAWRLTGRQDVAEDLTQESFLRLVRHPQRFDAGRGSLRQYLYGVVRNLARQHWQAQGREAALDDNGDDAAPLWAVPGGDPVAAVEVAGVVQAALAALPLLQREALVLFELEELPLEEIAAIVGADVGTVKSRLHRARERLRRSLAPYWNQTREPARKGVSDESTE